MAIVKFGAIVTDMRGKLGGHVFQKGNQSRVMKTRTKPRPSGSTFVIAGKQRLYTVQESWRSLSTAIKSQWSQFAIANPSTNRFNDPLVLTGLQYYTRSAMAFVLAGYSLPISVVGWNSTPGQYIFTSCNLNITSNVASLVGNSLGSGQRYQIWVCVVPNLNVKVTFDKFYFAQNYNTNTAGTSSPNFTLEQRFGPLTIDSIVYMAAVPVSEFGIAGAPQIVRSILSS